VTAEEVGLTLAEGKDLLGELARLILQTRWKNSPPGPRLQGLYEDETSAG
jgi:hypothetical protein